MDMFEDDNEFHCPVCGEVVGDENELCPECEQDDAEWRQGDLFDTLSKDTFRGWTLPVEED